MLLWFAETTIVAAILALVAIAASRLRPIAPSVRHALWLVVLIKFITPPLVSWPWAIDWRTLEWPTASCKLVSPVVAADLVPPMIAPVPPPGDQVSLQEDCSDNEPAPVKTDDTLPAIQLASTEAVKNTGEANPDVAAETGKDRVSVAAGPIAFYWLSWLNSVPLSRGLLIGWLTISVGIAIGQSIRIIRFRRRLRGAVPAPDFLIDEADRIGRWLGVTVPDLLVVDDLGTPLLWCLSRPQLVLPTRLVKTLPLDRWRGILTHELAHLRRRDQWVSRLELAAGLIWWWNPLYWLTRARLDAEAELACDAWVVWALPKDRLTYAEVLFDICSNLSLAKPMAPTLSVAGSGRFFERRLTMILHNHVPCRLSPLGFLGACLLVLFALPTWSAANLVSFSQDSEQTLTTAVPASGESSTYPITDDDKKAAKRQADDDRNDDDNDDADDADDADDDDDDQDEKALERAKAKAEAAKAKVEAIKAKIEAARAKGKEKAKVKEKGNKAEKPDLDIDLDIDLSKLAKELETKFGSGSDFEKQIEKLGETIGKEMEAKFGPGSDFEKQMEKLGKEIEGKLGEGSDFAKKMEAFGKEMEAKFGPGSDFEKKMKKLGEEMKEKYGPGSDFAKELEEKTAGVAKAKVKTDAKAGIRERRIKELEAQVGKLIEQIEALKGAGR